MPSYARQAVVTFAPLSLWPATHPRTPAAERVAAKFRASLDKTLRLLSLEVAKAGAISGKIELDIDPKALKRNGGSPYAGYQPRDPGVVLRFVREGSEVTMPCDQWETWQDNVRGITLTLVNLRAIERYGATAGGQQYRGFTALPAVTTPVLSTEQAARAVLKRGGKGETEDNVTKVIKDPLYARDVIRLALANAHPDRHGGSTVDFTLVSEARRILSAHFTLEL